MRFRYLLILSPFSLGIAIPADQKTLDFEEAIKKGLIQVEITSKGGHEDECLQAMVKNKTSKPIEVIFKPGALFNPVDTSFQDIILTSEKRIKLHSTITVPLTGYCCASSKRSPRSGLKFKTGKADPSLIKLCEFIGQNKFPSSAIQNAVWSVSDDEPIAAIYDELKESVQPLREVVSSITGRENVWYSTPTNVTEDAEGYIIQEPVEVQGNISIKAEKPCKLVQEVCKKNGKLVWKPVAPIDLPRAGNFTYKFRLKVTGWEKGEYVVRSSIGTKTISEQGFTI